jgi:hypothetical protein
MTLLTSCAMLKVVASGYGCNEYKPTDLRKIEEEYNQAVEAV